MVKTRPMFVIALLLLFATAGVCTPSVLQDPPIAQASGSLRIKTDAGSVQIWLDGQNVGQTPFTVRTVTAGKHRLVLVKDGFEDHMEEVEILPNQTKSVFVVMQPHAISIPPLPAEFKVIHQHRLGKCTGVLTVSAEFLDYKAVDDADTFHIPIATVKSVARSWGSVAGLAPIGIGAPTDLMAFRIETPGRSYGFLAFKDTVDDSMKVASEKTRELYEVVYKLWAATLKPKGQD